MASPPQTSRGWFTRAQAAEALGVHMPQFDGKYRPMAERIGAAKKESSGRGRVYIHLPTLIEELKTEAVAREVERAGGDPDLMGAAESGSLEEYRRWKAANEKLSYETRRGTLVERDHMRRGLREFIRVLRTAGEVLGRRFGSEAAHVLNEYIDDAAASANRVIAEPEVADE